MGFARTLATGAAPTNPVVQTWIDENRKKPAGMANSRHQASVLLRTLTERAGTPGMGTTGAEAQPPHRVALLLSTKP
jgi:hypothetical protein